MIWIIKDQVRQCFELEARKHNVAVADVRQSRVSQLFETPPILDNWPEIAIRNTTSRLHYIEAYYGFDALERSLEYRWILNEYSDDARYRLARVLLSTTIQNNYDRVIIDAPPRFTMGFINGICAATHVFVPTLVDAVSIGGVQYFAKQFRVLAPIVNPGLKVHGIIGTVNSGNAQHTLPQALQRSAERIDDIIKEHLGQGNSFIREAVVTRKAEIANASKSGIPYMIIEGIRPMYDKLAEIINRRAPRRQIYGNRAA